MLFFDADDAADYILYRTAYTLYGVTIYVAVEMLILPSSGRKVVERTAAGFAQDLHRALTVVNEFATARESAEAATAAAKELTRTAEASVAALPGASLELSFGLKRRFPTGPQ